MIWEENVKDIILFKGETEPLFKSDEIFVSYPQVTPAVSFDLYPTEYLAEEADLIRERLGYKPFFAYLEDRDPEGWYEFYVRINGYTKSRIDSCISFIVCNTSADDDGYTYFINLSEEEQQVVYKRLNELCWEKFRKGCRVLLIEADSYL